MFKIELIVVKKRIFSNRKEKNIKIEYLYMSIAFFALKLYICYNKREFKILGNKKVWIIQ